MADTILDKLTFEEKVRLVAGQDLWRTASIECLNVPYIKLTDGPSGARGGGDFNDATPSTLFPSPSCLGATWDDGLAYAMGRWIALDAAKKQCHVVLGPTINIQRDPRAGRFFESYSEDPFLTGLLAAAWVRGCQSTGLGATMKHFVGNEAETDRRFSNSKIGAPAMREIYLEPFRLIMAGCAREPTGGHSEPLCVMSAYNFVNGVSASQQSPLFNDILRDEWGYTGCVMSDWFALHAHALEATDLEMPGPSAQRRLADLREVFDQAEGEKRRALEKDLDRSAGNILRLVDRVKGLGYCAQPTDEDESSLVDKEADSAIRQIGAEGAVLLKNDDGLLPLQLRKGMKIACIGMPWIEAVQSGGGSANLTAQKVTQPIDALHRAIAQVGLTVDDVEVTHHVGCAVHNFVGTLTAPMKCDFYSGREVGKGDLVGTLTVDNATLKSSEPKPEGLVANDYWVRCSLQVPAARTGGRVRIGLVALGEVEAKAMLDDGVTTHCSFRGESDMFEFLLNPRRIWKPYELDVKEGQRIDITCDYMPQMLPEELKHLFAGGVQVGLEYVEDEDAIIEEAVSLAAKADAVIILTAAGKDWESEGYDRDHIRLPRRQNDLVQRVSRSAKGKTAVFNLTGSPIELPWLVDVGALVQAWYGGQEGGEALMDVLLARGQAPASGRLAHTWPKQIGDHSSAASVATFPGYKEEGKHVGVQVDYAEGRLVGYRHYNRKEMAVEPAYYFGAGVGGYTTFKSEGPFAATPTVIVENASSLPLTLHVKTANTGKRSGKEVIQLYVRRQGAPSGQLAADEPVQRLAAYTTVRLESGQEATLDLVLRQEAFSSWDEDKQVWQVNAGTYDVVLARTADLSDTYGSLTLTVRNAWTWTGLGV